MISYISVQLCLSSMYIRNWTYQTSIVYSIFSSSRLLKKIFSQQPCCYLIFYKNITWREVAYFINNCWYASFHDLEYNKAFRTSLSLQNFAFTSC